MTEFQRQTADKLRQQMTNMGGQRTKNKWRYGQNWRSHKKWCHGKVLEISRKWCHWKSWSKEPLILWCNVLWGTNKWLIRGFPKDLGIKRPILATQISSLFDSELTTPSLVYAIIWFSHWSKIEALPCSILRLGRDTVSAANSNPGSREFTVSSLSPQTGNNVNDLFFGQH